MLATKYTIALLDALDAAEQRVRALEDDLTPREEREYERERQARHDAA